MLYEIENAITSRINAKLTAAGETIAAIAGKKETLRPAVYCYIDSGDIARSTQDAIKISVSGSVLIVFKDVMKFDELSDESTRRKGVYAILEVIFLALAMQTLDLDITPLQLESFNDATTDDYRESGMLVYQLKVKTSYHLKRVDDETLVDWLRAGLNYYLQDPADDGVADAQDLLERTETTDFEA